jgi:hexulose-6-phosphate isomerase
MAIAIMQGRLVPPVDGRIQSFPRSHWRDEFGLAAAAGLDAIEWIYDADGEDMNPIATNDGLAEIVALSSSQKVGVRSLCADWFMDHPLLRAPADEVEKRAERLAWLIRRCSQIGVGRVVLPFVDASRIDSDAEIDDVVAVLRTITPVLDDARVEVHLETSLTPARFADLLDRVSHVKVRVNYDSGNSASLGYQPAEEFEAYGTQVGSVHIKDRVLGGSTVPLGTGDTDFRSLFECLGKVGYLGDFVLQVARGTPGDEVGWARKNREFVVALQAAA